MKRQYTKQIIPAIVALAALLLLPNVSAGPPKDVSDAEITRAITADFWSHDAVSANRIDVETENGIVTLSGSVRHILARDRAQEIVEALAGVRAVINRITVQPLVKRSDKELAEAVETAWLRDPAADSYELQAAADAGQVTITGTVESYAEKMLAATVAKGVKGVRGVENDIDVEYKTQRVDLEIKTEIEGRLENDVRVDDYLIDVAVKDGNVTLSGTVGSLQEKTRATTDAWVAGVKAVKTDGLDVEWWARHRMRRPTAVVQRSDDVIKEAVKAAFLYDPRVLSFNPRVDVDSGTVTLSGVVDNLAAKQAAEADARNTLGVLRVKNFLQVRPQLPGDDKLKERVAAALLDNPSVERFDVQVVADDGWVYLSGNVNTSYEKKLAGNLASRQKGVIGVVNRIDFDYEWVWKPDWEVREDVKSQLKWDSFVDEEDIDVRVNRGVVTLVGTVHSWSGRADAEKSAFEAGAKDVRNQLITDYQYYGPYGPS